MIFKALTAKAVLTPGDGPPGGPAPAAERYRDILLVVLTLTTGALDAVTFVRLGKVFSSVITGNLALLGVAVGRKEAALALDAGLALAGYAAGVLIGGPIAGTPQPGQPVWPVRVSYALAVETGLLAAFSGEWLATGGHPAGASRLALLLLAAAAMGLQSATVRRLGQISTTYLTSTLTALLTGLALRRKPEDWGRSSGILVTAVAGAALGTLAALKAPDWVPAAVLIPVAVVLAGSLWRRPWARAR
jgi:uncharacterized membrane protein YoaK (UPF0700 family)